MVSAGADHILSLPALRSDVVVTSVRGIHANPIASYGMMMMTASPMGLNNLSSIKRKEDGSSGAGEIWRAKRYIKLGWRLLGSKSLVGPNALECVC